MHDYKEAPVTGKKWQRCCVVHIDNTLAAQPMVTFAEEEVVAIGDETFIKPSGQLHFPFDPAAVIELRDPRTGELTGQTTTGAAVYTALYSLYIQKATERDSG